MLNKKSSTTTLNKKERIKKTIKSIVTSKDTKKNAAETKNKSTLELNNNKRSETKPIDVGQKVLPKQINGSNESDEKIIIEKPLVDKPLEDSKKSSKKATKADETKNNNNSGSIKPEQNTTIKKRLSVASISSSSSVTPTSNAETKNNIADNKRRMSSVVRSETSSRPSTPDIKKQHSSKISQNPSRPTTPDITKRSSSSRLTAYENSTPDITRKVSSRSLSSAAKRPTSIITNTNLSTNSRPASPELSKTTKRPTSIISSTNSSTNSRPASPELLKTTKRSTSTKSSTNSNTNSKPTSPELLKTTKRPTSTISSTKSSTNSRPASPELLKTTKRPTSIILNSSTKSSINSRPTSPELLKTTKRPTSMISITNSQPIVPEVKAKQSCSTQPNDSSNIITKSKQLSQQIPSTQVIKKQSFSQSSRPPSPEIIKLSEPPLISGKPNTSKPSRPSTPDITKSSTNETTRKRSISRPSTFEIQQLPELNRRQRSYSTTQMPFTTTFNSINTNSTLNSQIQKSRRTSFTSSIASQISDDSYFQRASTPTSDTSMESNDNYKITLDDCNTSSIDVNNNNVHEETNNDQLFTEKWVDENSNLFSETTNDKMCLVIDKKPTEINNFTHEDINQPKNRLVVFDSEQEITPAKTCVSNLNLSDNLTVIETSLENETDISKDKICNNDNSILSDNDNHKNELQQDEKDNSIQENNQKNIDIKESIEILDESIKEVKTGTKIDQINSVELVNNNMEKVQTIKNVKNVIEVNGNKLPAIIEQDLDLEQQSVEEIINSIFTPTKIETEEKHNLNLTEMAMNCEKPHIIEDCATKQQIFSNINLSQDNHIIKNNNTLNDNLCVMQNNINNINNINNQECILYLPSEPAIIEHGTISVYADPYKKYVGSYGTTPQDFTPFTNYETQDIIVRVDEKRFDEVMRQNFLGSSEIGYKENTITNLLKEPTISTENLLSPIDSITKEQQYYDVSISEDESLDSKYKMKRPSYGTFPGIYSYSNSAKSLHLGQTDEQSTFSSLCSCPIC